jgi:hypothetical protein
MIFVDHAILMIIRLKCSLALTRCRYAITFVWLIVFMWLILISLILTANVRHRIVVESITRRKTFCFCCRFFLVVVESIWIFSASLKQSSYFSNLFFFALQFVHYFFNDQFLQFCSFFYVDDDYREIFRYTRFLESDAQFCFDSNRFRFLFDASDVRIIFFFRFCLLKFFNRLLQILKNVIQLEIFVAKRVLRLINQKDCDLTQQRQRFRIIYDFHTMQIFFDLRTQCIFLYVSILNESRDDVVDDTYIYFFIMNFCLNLIDKQIEFHYSDLTSVEGWLMQTTDSFIYMKNLNYSE